MKILESQIYGCVCASEGCSSRSLWIVNVMESKLGTVEFHGCGIDHFNSALIGPLPVILYFYGLNIREFEVFTNLRNGRTGYFTGPDMVNKQ